MNSGVLVAINSNSCENRFPNCVRVELEIRPIDENGFDLVADILFGEHRIKTKKYGEATFGLRKGKLKVELDKCIVPLRNFKLYGEFQTEVEAKTQREEVKEGNFEGETLFK